jgi:hypothetical protein
MKKLYFLLLPVAFYMSASAQDFNKDLATARSAYKAGKLDDSRFAMQQMMQELDMLTGKEILKKLPATMMDQSASTGKDNVSGASGFAGVVIHREYGAGPKSVTLDIITNSPLLGAINGLLSLPFIANTGDQKVVKINGYKALIQKVTGDNNTNNYELQLPMSSSLLTLKAPGYTQEDVLKMANTLPIADIVKLVQ